MMNFWQNGKFIFFIITIFLSCCSSDDKIKIANQNADKYFLYVKSNHFDSVLTLFSPSFFKVTDTNSLLSDLKLRQKKCGNIVSAEFDNAKTSVEYNSEGKEETIELDYKVNYESKLVKRETLYFTFRGSDISGKIEGIHIDVWE